MEPVPAPQTTLFHFGCRSCGAELSVEAHLRTTVCPYCDSPAVVERPPTPNRPDPTFVLGFVIQRERAVEDVKRWLKKKSWFARSGFAQAKLEEVRGIYAPAYLYGAAADATYTVEIGENYKRDKETRTEWFDLVGRYSCHVQDRIVSASRGIPNNELEAIEPFDMGAIRRYTPAMLSGWISEEPSVAKEECFQLAHRETEFWLQWKLQQFMPGDEQSNLSFDAQVRDEHIELVMLPVWVFAARYDEEREPVRVLVNGESGKVGGKVPYSWLKITFAVLTVIGLLTALYFVLRSVS